MTEVDKRGFVSLWIVFSAFLLILGAVVYFTYNNFKDSGFMSNYVYDNETGLVWMKCDYGLAGTDCNIPGHCGFSGGGFSGVCQDSYGPISKVGSNANLTSNSIMAGCGTRYSKGRFVYDSESGFAVCSNGVLCKDGSFIVVDAKKDFEEHEEEYSSMIDLFQIEFIEVPNSAKDRACLNHGGVETFSGEPLYNWKLPSDLQLETLYEPSLGINKTLFPNSKDFFMSSTTIIPPVGNNYLNSVWFNKNGISKEKCVINAPVKCVYKVTSNDINLDNISQEKFCSSKIPTKLHIKFKMEVDTSDGFIMEDAESWIYITNDFIKTLHVLNLEGYPSTISKTYAYYDKKSNKLIIGTNWKDCYNGDCQEKCDKMEIIDDSVKARFSINGLIDPMGYVYQTSLSNISNETQIINGFSCTLTRDNQFDLRFCINKEHCLIVGETYSATKTNKLEVTSISTDFDETILEFPDNCVLVENY